MIKKTAVLLAIFLITLIVFVPIESLAGPVPKVRLRGGTLESIENLTLRTKTEKIQRRIENRGNRRTAHWDGIIDRLVAIHQRLDRQRNRFRNRGKDVDDLSNLIHEARGKRARAKQMVQAQDQRQYELRVGNELLIDGRIATLRTEEQGDLQAVQEQIRAAIESYKLAMDEAKVVKSQEAR